MALFLYAVKDNLHRIMDGDTIEVLLDRGFSDKKEKMKLRFAGLNAPETRTRRLLEKEAGLLVKEIVVRWVDSRKDKQFYVTSDSKPKYHGRMIGRFWTGPDDLLENFGKISAFEDCLNTFLLELKVVKVYTGGKRGFTDEELKLIIANCNKFLNSPS